MKILIVEDEPQTADLLAELIKELKPEALLVGITDSIDQTVRFLQSNKADVIFMDIQLADGLCFEIFSRVDVECPVVFCTAYDQYTLQAFKSNGVEYILKPVREEDVRAAFAKLDKLASAFRADLQVIQTIQQLFTEKKSYKSTVLIRYRESFIPVPVGQIAVFVLEDEILYAYRFDEQKHAVFKTLDEMESGLDPGLFYRINRQTLLNRNAVVEIQPYFNRKMVVKIPFKLKEQLVVSRLKVSPFMQWIEQA